MRYNQNKTSDERLEIRKELFDITNVLRNVLELENLDTQYLQVLRLFFTVGFGFLFVLFFFLVCAVFCVRSKEKIKCENMKKKPKKKKIFVCIVCMYVSVLFEGNGNGLSEFKK